MFKKLNNVMCTLLIQRQFCHCVNNISTHKFFHFFLLSSGFEKRKRINGKLSTEILINIYVHTSSSACHVVTFKF